MRHIPVLLALAISPAAISLAAGQNSPRDAEAHNQEGRALAQKATWTVLWPSSVKPCA